MIEIEDLTVSYGQSEVIHGISFSAAKNETLAIMGRNGMGKTTLFKSLMGILPSKSKKALVDGQDIAGRETYQRVNSGLAYVPQGRMIFPTMTVQENIETGLEKSASNKIPEDIYALFPVLYDMRGRKGGNLSGGQQQQLAIARALVTNPKVLLLDEPTSGLDPQATTEFNRLLSLLRQQNVAILMVTHDLLSAADVADRIGFLEAGRLVEEVAAEGQDRFDVRLLHRRYAGQA